MQRVSTQVSLVVFLTACILQAELALASPHVYGGLFNLFDDVSMPPHGPIQVLGATVGRRSPNNPDDYVCVAYVGTLAELDEKARVELADQVFDEMIGFDCAKRMFKGGDGLWRSIPRAVVYVENDVIVTLEDPKEFAASLVRGDASFNSPATRVEYALKQALPGLSQPSGFYGTEYVRVTQSDIPVGPSHREPNRVATPKEIEPDLTIGLENAVDMTYFEEERPTLLVDFQTQVSVNDEAAMNALCARVARVMGGERAARRLLNGVRLNAFNEPKRSRFHFRPLFTYDLDRDGKKIPAK